MTAFRVAFALFQLASGVVMFAMAVRLRRVRLELQSLVDAIHAARDR